MRIRESFKKNHSEDAKLPEKPKAGSTEKSETYKTKKPKNKTNIIAARTHNPNSCSSFSFFACNSFAIFFLYSDTYTGTVCWVSQYSQTATVAPSSIFRFAPHILHLRQHRTKNALRLSTAYACSFSVILHKTRLITVRLTTLVLHNLTKKLTAHLRHYLCAVLP